VTLTIVRPRSSGPAVEATTPGIVCGVEAGGSAWLAGVSTIRMRSPDCSGSAGSCAGCSAIPTSDCPAAGSTVRVTA